MWTSNAITAVGVGIVLGTELRPTCYRYREPIHHEDFRPI